MKTQEIYNLAIKLGIKSDLRGKEKVKKYLARAKKQYDKLDKKAKSFFDEEKLANPYSDTRILVGGNKKQIKKVLIGIDMEGPEMLLAKEIGDIDLIIAHHPEGKALADLHSVMDLQAQVLADYGVPINIAEAVIKPRIEEVARGTSPVNHNRSVDFARLLGFDFMCVHTPADNLGARFMFDLIKEKKPEYIEDLIELIEEIPEYKEAQKVNAGVKLFSGDKQNSCGRIAVTDFTGGTEGAKEMYAKMSQAGIGTIIGMHMSEDRIKEAKKHHLNVVIAGHMSSDSLGLNLFIDELEKKGIEVMTCSGIYRVKRNKKRNKI